MAQKDYMLIMFSRMRIYTPKLPPPFQSIQDALYSQCMTALTRLVLKRQFFVFKALLHKKTYLLSSVKSSELFYTYNAHI